MSLTDKNLRISKFRPTTSCVSLYPSPWVLATSIGNSCQLVTGYTPWPKVNFINTVLEFFHNVIKSCNSKTFFFPSKFHSFIVSHSNIHPVSFSMALFACISLTCHHLLYKWKTQVEDIPFVENWTNPRLSQRLRWKDKRNLVLCPYSEVDLARPVWAWGLGPEGVNVLVLGNLAVLKETGVTSSKAALCLVYNQIPCAPSYNTDWLASCCWLHPIDKFCSLLHFLPENHIWGSVLLNVWIDMRHTLYKIF